MSQGKKFGVFAGLIAIAVLGSMVSGCDNPSTKKLKTDSNVAVSAPETVTVDQAKKLAQEAATAAVEEYKKSQPQPIADPQLIQSSTPPEKRTAANGWKVRKTEKKCFVDVPIGTPRNEALDFFDEKCRGARFNPSYTSSQ